MIIPDIFIQVFGGQPKADAEAFGKRLVEANAGGKAISSRSGIMPVSGPCIDS